MLLPRPLKRALGSFNRSGFAMLELKSSRWTELSHAYGDASDIPELLSELEDTPQESFDEYEAEPWYSLWSALCHQGTTYTASYAAIPHVIRIAQEKNEVPHALFFLFPASVEISRLNGLGTGIPGDLVDSYFHSLQQLHQLAHKLAHLHWSEFLGRSIAAALLATKGHGMLADMIRELDPEGIKEIRRNQGWEESDLG